MASDVRQYLKESAITDRRILYRWDDWDLDQYLDEPDASLVATLEPLSHRANVALAIGMTEWIIQRYSAVSADQDPWLIIEAAWAKSINWRYAEYIELNDDDWKGPIRRPIQLALESVQEILDSCVDDDDTAEDTASISKLALHVLPVSDRFITWRTAVIRRLEKFYKKREDDPVGPPIPREGLDPSIDFTPEMTDRLIKQFLASLDPRANEWLHTPDQMEELKFEGTPYQWEADRDQDRFL